MHISLAEVQTSISKATLAIGLPIAHGADAGSAARYMMEIGLGSFAAFVDAIDSLEAGKSIEFGANQAIKGTFLAARTGKQLSALHAGPSACDLIVSSTPGLTSYQRITLTDIDVPIVILFELLNGLKNFEAGVYVGWNEGTKGQVKLLCWKGSLVFIKGEKTDLAPTGPQIITVDVVKKKPRNLIIPAGRHVQRTFVNINQKTWRRVAKYASRQLVQSTITSKLSGAGAGIVEVD